MDESLVKTNSLRAWLLAARPKTLTGAAVPVMIGASMALSDSGWTIEWLPCVLCFLFAFVMQIDANFVNDYFDYKKGNDDVEMRLGPLRACTMGWITPAAMKSALFITTALACLIGLPLIWYGGWLMIVVGVLCVLFCYLYTTRLSYLGLGDLLVLIFFGLVPVCLTYYLSLPASMQTLTWQVVLASLACGFVIDTLLLVNNNRDIANDYHNGKLTLVVRVGAQTGKLLYFLAGIVAWALVLVFSVSQHSLCFVLTTVVYLPAHYRAYKLMLKIDHGKELNRVLATTAFNMFLFGFVVSLGILLS